MGNRGPLFPAWITNIRPAYRAAHSEYIDSEAIQDRKSVSVTHPRKEVFDFQVFYANNPPFWVFIGIRDLMPGTHFFVDHELPNLVAIAQHPGNFNQGPRL
jgi:hypothetical protein